jgi:receptor protein-tyrosine kinase
MAYEENENAPFAKSLVTVVDPTNSAAEAYRLLRTKVFYASVDNPPKVILFTSPDLGEGKTTTCANLGVVLTQAEKSTLIIDCDWRIPEMHKVFGLRNFKGLVNALASSDNPLEICQEPLPRLKVLTAGPVPPNPAELLSSGGFAQFLRLVRREFDYVLIDAPAVEMVSDPVILAAEADGVLLVVDAQSTRKESVRRSVRTLKAVEANILGTVVNNVEA